MINITIIPFDSNNTVEVEFICRRHLETPSIWIKDYSYSEEELNETKVTLKESGQKGLLLGLTAKTDTDIIGFIWAEKVIKRSDTVKIISLWTAPDFRKQGIATALKLELEKVVKAMGFKKIKTNVYSPNSAMLEMNLKLGYKIIRYDLEKEI